MLKKKSSFIRKPDNKITLIGVTLNLEKREQSKKIQNPKHRLPECRSLNIRSSDLSILYSDVEGCNEIRCPGHDVTELHGRQVAVTIDVGLVDDFAGNGVDLSRRQSAFEGAQSRYDRFQVVRPNYSVGIHICVRSVH